MRLIPVDAGPVTTLSYVRILALRLKARKDTAALASDVDARRVALKSSYDTWSEQHDATLASTCAIVFADSMEDDVVADLARQAKVLVDGDIRSAAYLRLFSQAPSDLTRGLADDTQAALVEHLIDTIQNKPEYTSLRDLVPELQAARAEVVAAQASRSACERAEAASWTELQIAERGCREVYRDTHPKLQTLFPGRKRLVDSFFYRPPKRKKTEGEVEPTGTQ